MYQLFYSYVYFALQVSQVSSNCGSRDQTTFQNYSKADKAALHLVSFSSLKQNTNYSDIITHYKITKVFWIFYLKNLGPKEFQKDFSGKKDFQVAMSISQKTQVKIFDIDHLTRYIFSAFSIAQISNLYIFSQYFEVNICLCINI